MTARSTRAPRLRRATVPVALALGLVLPAAPASAHTRLVSSSPAPGAEVPSDTRDVVLSFDGAVRERISAVAVTAPNGSAVAPGPVTVRGTDVVLALAPPLVPGAWSVAYRVVADDGHPISGRLTFTVAAAPSGPAPPASASPPASAAPASSTGDAAAGPQGNGTSPVLPVVGGLAVAAGLGAVLLRRRTRRGGATSR